MDPQSKPAQGILSSVQHHGTALLSPEIKQFEIVKFDFINDLESYQKKNWTSSGSKTKCVTSAYKDS